MKTMPYIMAIMFFFMFNQNASGLSYYYFVSTLITILQYFAFRWTLNEDKLLRQLEENKKKPRKKSKWRQRPRGSSAPPAGAAAQSPEARQALILRTLLCTNR